MSDLTRERIQAIRRSAMQGSGRYSESDVDALCAMALRALDAGWQPMSTAPRDGTLVLVTTSTEDESGRRTIVIGRFNDEIENDEEMTDAYGFLLDDTPIAWMPLPPPCAEVPHE